MLLEIYPKPDGMQHINFMFCAEQPDPEDIWIRAHLDALPMPPKRSFDEVRNGRNYTTLQYGQCVIGHSMFYIEKHKGVVDAIVRLSEGAPTFQKRDSTAHGTPNQPISRLALELESRARFTVNDAGKLAIAFRDIDDTHIRRRLGELVAEDATLSMDGTR